MKPQDSMEKRREVHRLALGVLLLGAVACTWVLAAPAPADPHRGRGDAPQAFLSGSERSLSILREIQDVLGRIDSRLEQMDSRLERMGSRLEQMGSRLEQIDGRLARMNFPAGASQPPPPETMERPRGRDH